MTDRSPYPRPTALRLGAAFAVLAVHAAVVAALTMSPSLPPEAEPVTVQIRFVELAPEQQQVAAPSAMDEPVSQPEEPVAEPEPEPEPPLPEPEPEPLPPEPEPEPEHPPPEPEPEPPPPELEPEPPPPEPEPTPAPEPPPPPKPKPKPEPKPEPKPKPKPKPEPKPKPKPQPPKPAPPVPAPPSPAPAAAPATAQSNRNATPDAPVAPPSDEPRLIRQVEYLGRPPVPTYPRIAQRMGETGRVVVRVLISTEGRVQRATVQRSSGHSRLDEAALNAAQRARFRPYTENGVARAALADLPFDFVL
ncbi:MAG: TonB family protein [Pigmentiphaga sp.]|nr:TonB family protein [Pigmentiphaga sp.]